MRLATTTTIMLAVFLLGCKEDTAEETDTEYVPLCELDTSIPCPCDIDADDDGYCADDPEASDYDCDDSNPDVHPGQEEVCNGIDDNCVAGVDEGLPDADGDGICNAMDEEECDGYDNDGDGEIDEGFPDTNEDGVADCVDHEVCNGVDDDGDGLIDEDFDSDGDGATTCGPDGYPDTGDEDCDDTNPNAYPGASEVADNYSDDDCDGLIDESAWAQGDLFVTEIMTNPSSVSDPNGEWFEVYNGSTRVVVLNGLIIAGSDGDRAMVKDADPILLDPGEYYVFGSNDDSSVNGGVRVDYRYNSAARQYVTLGNDSDDLILKINDEGVTTIIDSVAWDGGETFPDPNGASMILEPDYTEAAYNDDGTYWCASTESWAPLTDAGSPGEANESCTSFDHDGDGYSADDGDCDDEDDEIYPGAPESDDAVDNDCDGDIEEGPEASAELGSGSDTEQCGLVYLDGTESYDPNGDTPLTYEWTMTSAPSSSALTSADILNPTSSMASFYPDAAGTFTFALTVWDSGSAASEPATLSVSIDSRSSNSSPVADAGSTQSYTAYADCLAVDYGASYDCDSCDSYEFTLDGSGSSDSDGDYLYYAWTVASGSASLDDATSENPVLTVAGATPTSPSSSTYTNVYVSLKVTDCMGATSSSDTVAISYECEGD